MAINWITPRHGGQGGARSTNAACRVSTRRAGDDRVQTNITVYESLMRELRWVAGDRIAVGTTDDGDLAFKRVPAGGYCLSPQGNFTSEERKKVTGKAVTCNVKFTADIAKRDRVYQRTEILVESDGTVILIQD